MGENGAGEFGFAGITAMEDGADIALEFGKGDFVFVDGAGSAVMEKAIIGLDDVAPAVTMSGTIGCNGLEGRVAGAGPGEAAIQFVQIGFAFSTVTKHSTHSEGRIGRRECGAKGKYRTPQHPTCFVETFIKTRKRLDKVRPHPCPLPQERGKLRPSSLEL
jgi:hypothetical protein